MAKFDIKPGDLIEWMYKCNDELVDEHKELYSSIEKRWVPIGRELVHVCISIDDETISWLNEKGLFRAHVNSATRGQLQRIVVTVVPRVRER